MRSDSATRWARPSKVLLAERTSVVQVATTEVRWILPGAVPADVAGWFSRFAPRLEARDDLYLRRPRLDGLSVKVRGGSSLDVKFPTGTDGSPISLGPATGRTSACEKWSFVFGSRGDDLGPEAAGWQTVGKVRRISRFSPDGHPVPPPAPGQPAPAGCAVELTDITLGDERWWTLGFEATGPVDGRRASIEAAAAALFARPLPTTVHLDHDSCLSYSAWLARL